MLTPLGVGVAAGSLTSGMSSSVRTIAISSQPSRLGIAVPRDVAPRARVEQRLDDGGAEEPGPAGDDDATTFKLVVGGRHRVPLEVIEMRMITVW